MIYFVRHGETDYNIKRIVQGQLDIPLNETGRENAHTLSNTLKNYQFDVIYCSPLCRARETAEIINQHHNVKIIFDDRLKEFFAGERQGLPVDQWSKEQDSDFMVHPEKYGAETNLHFYTRCVEAYSNIPKDKNVLIVAHGGVYKNIHRFTHNFEDITAPVSLPENCAVIELPTPKIQTF